MSSVGVFIRICFKVPFDSVIKGFDTAIKTISANGSKADMILVPGNFTIGSDLRTSPKYKAHDRRSNSLEIGTYDGIPVYRLFAKGLASKCIVMSFKQAMSLTILENKNLYENRLHLALRELTNIDIDQYFKAQTTRWMVDRDGLLLTEEQAKLRRATSLIIEVWSMGKFEIKETKAMVWCQFSAAATAIKR